tara:strand:+ start:1378 stop:1629 length:252 start_codon:yes stop_codon:yes gene_type:complete
MAITHSQAILAINSNAEFKYINDDISTINWLNGTTPISVADIEAKKTELENAENNKENLKSSAKAKLVAGEALTEDEANTIVV